MTDRDATRATLVERLHAAAVQRFGAERAALLRPTIELTATHLADVAAFPLEVEDGPAFFMDPPAPERAR
jgi:hypothetical protein